MENEEEHSESPVLETPPTPAQPVYDPAILAAYQEQLRAEARANADLRRQLEEKNRQPAPVSTPEQEKAFFDQPKTAVRDVVREELAQTVGPINQYLQVQQRMQILSALKQQMHQLPQQFPYVGQVEGVLDQILSNVANITPDVVAMAYNQAVGTYIHNGGRLDVGNPTPNPTPNNPVPQNNAPLPPHVRTSPVPPRPNDSNTPKVRALSENEKKIARYRGMTDAEYVFWTDGVKSGEVANLSDDEINRRINGK